MAGAKNPQGWQDVCNFWNDHIRSLLTSCEYWNSTIVYDPIGYNWMVHSSDWIIDDNCICSVERQIT